MAQALTETHTKKNEREENHKGEDEQVVYGLGKLQKMDGGFWVLSNYANAVKSIDQTFRPRKEDILLVSMPKTGTTWAKSLLHSILVSADPDKKDLLQLKNPHWIVPTIETYVTYAAYAQVFSFHELTDVPLPRLLHTHLPIQALPPLNSKVVYILRNPRDAFVSNWKFHESLSKGGVECFKEQDSEMSRLFQAFCDGRFHGGPFVDHVVGYLRYCKLNPDKIFFLDYDDLLANSYENVASLARFLVPSTSVAVSSVVEKCSFLALSRSPPNSSASMLSWGGGSVPFSVFFRRGKSGEWKNYFSCEMIKRIRNDIEEQLEHYGIRFHY